MLIRGKKVILDSDLARIYAIPTFRLNEAVKRNLARFPEDFMFQLTSEEYKVLTSQIAISNTGRGGRRTSPYVFTEHGAMMAANVLKSERAVRMSVYVVRAFVKLREMFATHVELAQKLSELEWKVGRHDADIGAIVDAIRQLTTPPDKPRRRIGFRVNEDKVPYR
ncbi:MAG: ORF6N domain-containing protein, partial [Ignavibacteriales bacterium]|nr:ORF6N domain-containing protein [Ignavibacteriales bacterium]